MNGIIGIGGVIALLLLVGVGVGMAHRRQFTPRWLLIAAGLILLNDALLTKVYGLIPGVLPGTEWNWQGKIIALVATVVIAASPAFGFARSGLTVRHAQGSLASCLPVALLYCATFLAVAFVLTNEPVSRETIAYQLSMPGLEEEPFYRGILLLALDRAFLARQRVFGVDWSWGAVLSCALFGLAHAFGYSRGAFSFDPLTMALTTLPSVILVWLRLRTGSLLLPILLHNFGNSISLFV